MDFFIEGIRTFGPFASLEEALEHSSEFSMWDIYCKPVGEKSDRLEDEMIKYVKSSEDKEQ